jgi:hypothetical protein
MAGSALSSADVRASRLLACAGPIRVQGWSRRRISGRTGPAFRVPRRSRRPRPGDSNGHGHRDGTRGPVPLPWVPVNSSAESYEHDRPGRWLPTPPLDPVELANRLAAMTGVRLEVQAPCRGGEVGAAYVRWPDGHRSVLTHGSRMRSRLWRSPTRPGYQSHSTSWWPISAPCSWSCKNYGLVRHLRSSTARSSRPCSRSMK